MVKRRILQWADVWNEIKDDDTRKLLLGNGASIAIDNRFRYQSLYEEADKSGKLARNLKKIFEDYKTTDFEYILRILGETNRINKLLNIPDSKTFNLYRRLKSILVQTITEIHPEHGEVYGSLRKIATFMRLFNTVVSLNYDLLVYWAMLAGNDLYGKWFKDCLIDDGSLPEEYDFLRQPIGDIGGATLVFYPHGNLILARDIEGEEIKIVSSEYLYLLEAIIESYDNGDFIPLIVSEGTTDEKMRAIRQSYYLSRIYYEEVEAECDSLVIYGWSMRDDDTHILRALTNGRFSKVAISVHSGSKDIESYCDRVTLKIKEMHRRLHKENEKYRILFFESASEGCWNN